MHLIFYVRWQTTLSLATITFLYVVRNIIENPISKKMQQFLYMFGFSQNELTLLLGE